MKRNHVLIVLIVLLIAGSLMAIQGTNTFFDDIFNISVGAAGSTLITSLPAVALTLAFVAAIFYVIRLYKHPDCMKSLTRLYLIFALIIGFCSVLGSILSAALIYHDFFGTHPFAGYHLIFLLLGLCLIGGGVFGLLQLKKFKEDTGKIKINFIYVLKTIGWFLFILLTLNRFGNFLGAPQYVYLRNLGQTFPFYLYLLMPVYLAVILVLRDLDYISRKNGFLMGTIALGLNLVFFVYIALMGMNDTAFVSSLSPAMPLERMASMPMEILIHFLSYLGVGIAVILLNRKPKEA